MTKLTQEDLHSLMLKGFEDLGKKGIKFSSKSALGNFDLDGYYYFLPNKDILFVGNVLIKNYLYGIGISILDKKYQIKDRIYKEYLEFPTIDVLYQDLKKDLVRWV